MKTLCCGLTPILCKEGLNCLGEGRTVKSSQAFNLRTNGFTCLPKNILQSFDLLLHELLLTLCFALISCCSFTGACSILATINTTMVVCGVVCFLLNLV